MNNIARVALQGLAAVLGGTQSLHTDSYDEALALPTAEAARIALRTQQVIAYESGVANTIDPLAGSYFVERLTLDMENGALEYFDKLDAMGGMVKAIERGFPQKEIAEASYQFQRATEAREKITVGANEFVIEEESPTILYIGEGVGERQKAKLQALRARRDNEAVRQALEALKRRGGHDAGCGWSGGEISEANTMPYILEAVRAYATVGEICEALREVYGSIRGVVVYVSSKGTRLQKALGAFLVSRKSQVFTGQSGSVLQYRNCAWRGIMRGEYFHTFIGDTTHLYGKRRQNSRTGGETRSGWTRPGR